MGTMEAAQHVYVVKVRALPDPALLFPSERRYSALTVAGLAGGHALLGAVAMLLGALAVSWDSPLGYSGAGGWAGHLGAGLWLGLAALQASACGLLAWRRWYEDRYIVWFFRSSLLAALVAAAGLVLTSAALAHLHENILSPHARLDLWQPLPGEVGPDTTEDSGSQWLDLSDSNSSTISSGGLFADQDHHEEDLLAADSTHREETMPGHELRDDESLRWSPLPISPRASAQIRSLVGVNVLVASLLELLWSLLGARVAWRGMKMDPASGHPESQTVPAAVPVSVPALERGAADGKVDYDNEKAAVARTQTGQQEQVPSKRKERQQGDPIDPTKLRTARRRAPGLPELSFEHSTMNLEERVARFLDRSQVDGGRASETK